MASAASHYATSLDVATHTSRSWLLGRRTLLRIFATLSCALGSAAVVHAQTASGRDNGPAEPKTSGGLEEIIVSVNRRSENLQDVPVAITVLRGENLQSSGVNSSVDLIAAVPGLNMSNNNAGVQIHLRGIGTSAVSTGEENSVATYLDGVYIASMNSLLFQLNSIQQIEVDKGPQGTLFGRNATGGVISITTKDPSHTLHGLLAVGGGNFNTIGTDDYLTGGITDTLAADLAVHFSDQLDGYGRNLHDGTDTGRNRDVAVRSKWLYTPTDSDRITAAVDFEQTVSSYVGGWHALPGSPTNWGPGTPPFGQPYLFTGGPWDIDQVVEPSLDVKQGGAAITYQHEFAFASLTSVTAYRSSNARVAWNAQPIPVPAEPVAWRNPEHQFTQELRLSSKGASDINWVAGLFYLDSRSDYDPFLITGSYATPPPLQNLTLNSVEGTSSYSAFGQATAAVPGLDRTNLTVGLRYTADRRSIRGYTLVNFIPALSFLDSQTGTVDTAETFKKPTWRIAIDHRFSAGLLGYVSYNRGFKSGVYNTIPASVPAVKPEVLDAYEAGIKSDLFDKRVRLNLAGFYYDYSQIQVTVFTPVSAVLENGAKAEIYGLDADIEASLTDRLTVSAGLEALHDAFTSFPSAQFLIPQTLAQGGGNLSVPGDAQGNRLPYASNLTFDIAGNYAVPISYGALDFNITYAYASKWYAGPDNILKSPASNLVNAQVGWMLPGEHTRAVLWVKNITNQAVPTILVASANPGGYDEGVYQPPRTFGAQVQYRF